MIDTLHVALGTALIVSAAITFFAVWYSIRLSRTLIYFSENMNDLLDMLDNYAKHVKSVYSLESFYGDQVLHNLLKHSRDIVEQIESFDEILYLTEEQGDQMNEQEEQIEQDYDNNREQTEEAKNPQRIRSGL